MQASLTIWSLVTPAFDLVRVFIGDVCRAGFHEVAHIYTVARLFDLGVIGWLLYLYTGFLEEWRGPPECRLRLF